MHKKIEMTDEIVDPGGQPDTRTGQPLELGFFAWNLRGGLTMTHVPPEKREREHDYWQWPIARRLVQEAERIGFDAQIPFGRWLGYPGESDFNGASLDFLATASATASLTQRMGVYSTAHITFKFHPMHIAKFGATVDHMSNGRWGLNIVTGYQENEAALFGMTKPFEREVAYRMAEEFVVLMKYMWTEDEPFDFEGEFFQSYGAYLAPKPVRKPRPVLINAGLSPSGIRFAARNVDWIFTVAPDHDALRERVQNVHNQAAGFGRNVRVAGMTWALPEASDSLAKDKFDELLGRIDRDATSAAADNTMRVVRGQEPDTEDPYRGIGQETYERLALGYTASQLVGGPETVAEQIRAMHETGLESLFISFVDPLKGLQLMESEIIPILKKMGIRK